MYTMQQIENILSALGLYDHQFTMTDRLSGGQKKRLSVALELINNPTVLWLDEPTTYVELFMLTNWMHTCVCGVFFCRCAGIKWVNESFIIIAVAWTRTHARRWLRCWSNWRDMDELWFVSCNNTFHLSLTRETNNCSIHPCRYNSSAVSKVVWIVWFG